MNFKHMLFRAASALLLVSGLGFAGCDDADPDAFLSVTRQEIEVEYTGLTTEGEMVNFELGTNRSWRATYVEEWIHLTHTEGDRGRVRIFLSIDENNTGEDRTGFIIFEGDGGTRRTIAVTQKLKVDALSVTPAKITVVKSGLLETGEKAAIFISTNCDWEISVADDSKWISPVKTSGAPGDESIDLDIAQNTTDGVRTGTFTVTADSKTATVTVAILEGPGSINGDQGKESEPMTPGEHWEWTPMSVKLYGITGETRVVIRSTQQGLSGYYRWYLDNVKMTKIAAE